MSLKVVCFSTYLTSVAGGWRPADYDAHDFIDAIKDRDINKYAYVWLRGKWHRFDNSNRQDVVGWFASMVSDYFQNEDIDPPLALVPVPGSKVDLAFKGQPRITQLATAIADTVGDAVTVRDVLRWGKAMPSANAQGGTRKPAELFAKLAVTGRVKGMRIVLVDDVLTSGGHLQACAAKLREAGADVVLAVCAGRADQQQPADPFAIRVEDIADYSP